MVQLGFTTASIHASDRLRYFLARQKVIAMFAWFGNMKLRRALCSFGNARSSRNFSPTWGHGSDCISGQTDPDVPRTVGIL